MPLVTLEEILKDAVQKHYAVGMFDTHNLEMTEAILHAAQEERSPVIMALAEVHIKGRAHMQALTSILRAAVSCATVPVCIHLDHGTELEWLVQAMHMGFSSVMFDGSQLPYEENVRKTTEIVRLARIFGISAEAELGHVGGMEGDDGHQGDCVYTDPDKAADFVGQTGIDALAVSIGTVHGIYRKTPKLDLERLSEIAERVPVPLVLHGGSGLSDEDFKGCIQRGIAKVNIYTDIAQAAVRRIRDELISDDTAVKPDVLDYHTLVERSSDGIKKEIQAKMRLFGSSGKA